MAIQIRGRSINIQNWRRAETEEEWRREFEKSCFRSETIAIPPCLTFYGSLHLCCLLHHAKSFSLGARRLEGIHSTESTNVFASLDILLSHDAFLTGFFAKVVLKSSSLPFVQRYSRA
jgi:hypothetical protein